MRKISQAMHSAPLHFFAEQPNLEKTYPSMYYNVTVGKIVFFDTKISESTKQNYLERGLYHSITYFVEAMNTLIQERHEDTETCIAVKVSRRTQKVELKLAHDGSVLAFFSTELCFTFGSNVGNDCTIFLKKRTSQAGFR